MAKFRQQPSRRRQPNPSAKWLVLGLTEARLVAHGQRSVHIAFVKPSDHRKRYVAGQRLQVRAFVGGPTEARVTVTTAERIQLADVDYGLVRELGYVRLDQFQVTWVERHDEAWAAKLLEEFPDHADVGERFCRKEKRFHARHAHRDIWVIRFDLDRAETPRMLAQGGRDRATYRKLPDGRWQCAEGAEDAEADRGYTSVDAFSLREAGRALSDEEWKESVEANKDLTHEQWLALGRLNSTAAKAQARIERGRSMRKKAA
jgi:hypothetical protein